MLLTFREGKHALEAIKYNNQVVRTILLEPLLAKLQNFMPYYTYYTCYPLYQIGGKELLVGLRTPHWREQIEREMSLVRSNTGTLFNTFTNSLLGEDFSIPTMSFDGKYSHFTCSLLNI